MAQGTSGGERRHDDGTGPLYRLVVKALQSEIVRGVYPVGTQLPSETTLMQRFSVSRHTVREAIRHLREGGLVRSHQGLGTIVQQPGTAAGYSHRIDTIGDLFPTNVETRYEPVTGELVLLPEEFDFVPEGQRAGRWLRIDGLRFRPCATRPFNDLSIYVAARFAGVGRVLGPHSGSIYALVETIYGESITEVEQSITTFVAGEGRGGAMSLAEGSVGVEVRRTYRLGSDDVALVSRNRYAPDDFTFTMKLRRVRD